MGYSLWGRRVRHKSATRDGRGRHVSRGRAGGVLGSARPFGGVQSGGMRSALLFFPALQKWQLHFLVSLYIFLSIFCPSCSHMCSCV